MNEEVDVRHKRRAISPREVQELVKSARESGVSIQRFDGEQRARIYIIAYMTGLRRKELGMLTKRSFDLQADPATLTVEAMTSKHRKKDTLPIHPDLVQMLSEWLADMAPGQKLFPNLEKKKTWLMVKKDLERVDIPYENDDGIADFHAAGRHTYITGLLSNGTSVVDAMKLARHSDVRTTMRYTHIGLEQQASAIKNLPWQHENPQAETAESESGAQHSSSDLGGTGCQEMAVSDTGESGVEEAETQKKPCSDGKSHNKADADNESQQWRRRGSNPRPATFPQWPLRV